MTREEQIALDAARYADEKLGFAPDADCHAMAIEIIRADKPRSDWDKLVCEYARRNG